MKTTEPELTLCRIKFLDDGSEIVSYIAASDEIIPDKDEHIFYYGLDRQYIIECIENGWEIDNEFEIMEVYPDIMERHKITNDD